MHKYTTNNVIKFQNLYCQQNGYYVYLNFVKNKIAVVFLSNYGTGRT